MESVRGGVNSAAVGGGGAWALRYQMDRCRRVPTKCGPPLKVLVLEPSGAAMF